MLRMVLRAPREPLVAEAAEMLEPGDGEVRLNVSACGVCRTDLHVIDGELAPQRAQVTPGHQVVGRVDAIGPGVRGVVLGERLGVPWLGGTCGECPYCRSGEENLCDRPTFTGWTRDGGYAESILARADFCLPIPQGYSDTEAAPLLCAGVIGFRAWRLACQTRPVRRLGLFGFGAAAHLLAQLALKEGQLVYAFTRPGDGMAQRLALELGCRWASGSDEAPADLLDAAIIFATVGALIPAALTAVRKGGAVVCAGIHMSDIPQFPYALLWGERKLLSVANLTRQDGRDYLPRAAAAGVRAAVELYPLLEANRALDDLRQGRFAGAAVLTT